MVAELIAHQHPIAACAQDITTLLTGVGELQPVYMSLEDKRAALLALTGVQRQVEELRLRVIASCGDLAEADGARDVATWLAARTQAETSLVRADEHLAVGLDTRWERVRAAMASGTVSLEQARVIVTGLQALPDHVDADVVARAEEQLVAYAADFKPSQLRRLARHILDIVAPEIADAEEARRLETDEQRAREKTSLRTRRLGDGITRTTILHPDAEADRLLTYLDAYTSPRHDDHTLGGEAERIPAHRKRGQAFGALLEHLDPATLPAHGGDATTVMVSVTLDALRTELATAGLIDGDLAAGPNLTAAQARRLACTAQIIPVVLGGKGEILDLGRTRRLFNPAQRKALRLRDQHCRAEGCTTPATWCEAHHLRPWSQGGNTDLADGVLLCSWHHHRIHDRRYVADRLPTGDVRFHRRT